MTMLFYNLLFCAIVYQRILCATHGLLKEQVAQHCLPRKLGTPIQTLYRVELFQRKAECRITSLAAAAREMEFSGPEKWAK